MKTNKKKSITTTLPLIILFTMTVTNLQSQTFPYQDSTLAVADRVEDLLSRMTLEEKIGQMMQVDQTAINGKQVDIKNYFLGSVLSGGDSKTGNNTTTAWADHYDQLQSFALQTRLKIPMIYGIDAVHGNNDLLGTTIFPHNIGLGCTRDTTLVEQVARITAREVNATGIDWTFSPCIAVTRDIRWGRTYEGFGETPELAELLGRAAVKGYQGDSLSDPNSIVACSKHYLADGGTMNGQDQGNAVYDETKIRELFLPGYINAVNSGVGTIMASFSSINGLKMHGSKYWLTDVLKDELGFKGFIISDWAAVDQLGANYQDDVRDAVNAGMDMIMVPYKYTDCITAMKNLANSNEVPIERIDDAVRRILRIKFMKGLFERPYADRSLISEVGSAEHRLVAREAVRKSLVMLKRKDNILPLPKNNGRILVAGSHANDIGFQCGGWTVTWQGKTGNTTTGTTILEGMQKAVSSTSIDYSLSGDYANTNADYSVVIIGETPYAEGTGDKANLAIQKSDVELIKKMKSYGHPVVVIIISGRPLIIESILHFSDAIIAAWLPGTEGDGISDVLFGDYQPHGILSKTWPKSMDQVPINIGDENYDPLYPYGFGLTSFNNSENGSSPKLLSSIVTKEGKHIELTFNKSMKNPSSSNAQFTFTKNNSAFNPNYSVSLKDNDSTTLVINLEETIEKGDIVLMNYNSGSLVSHDDGTLSTFENYTVLNLVVPAAIQIPSEISSDKFSDMYGMQIETTSDFGGGQNFFSIDDGDWVEYIINVPSTQQLFFSMRISSESVAGNVSVLSGTKTLFSRSLPITGNWNTWSTVKQLTALSAGEQTIRINVTKGGFKLHWISITSTSTDVDENNEHPLAYRLEQNYPNPFNPITEIKYTIMESGNVELKIYNVYGQLIRTLIDGFQQPNHYTVKFDATDLSSGVYIYRLTSKSFIQSGKMLLVK